MDCKICFRKYNESISQLTPRILTSCGHTLCEYCIKKQKKFGKIVCPFDRIVTVVKDGVDQLCKNFALLEIIGNLENPDPQILYSEEDSEEEEESDFEHLPWDLVREDPRLEGFMDPDDFEEEEDFEEEDFEEEEDYEYLHDMYLL